MPFTLCNLQRVVITCILQRVVGYMVRPQRPSIDAERQKHCGSQDFSWGPMYYQY